MHWQHRLGSGNTWQAFLTPHGIMIRLIISLFCFWKEAIILLVQTFNTLEQLREVQWLWQAPSSSLEAQWCDLKLLTLFEPIYFWEIAIGAKLRSELCSWVDTLKQSHTISGIAIPIPHWFMLSFNAVKLPYFLITITVLVGHTKTCLCPHHFICDWCFNMAYFLFTILPFS